MVTKAKTCSNLYQTRKLRHASDSWSHMKEQELINFTERQRMREEQTKTPFFLSKGKPFREEDESTIIKSLL